MIDPVRLRDLWTAHRDALESPVRRLDFPRFGRVFEDRPYQLGVINLSRDSSYRESICPTLEHALYRARRMTVEGAAAIDLGAESTGETAARVAIAGQIERLRPVTEALVAENMLVSVETYHPEVAVALLEAGAGIVNLTGRVDDRAFYEAVARHEAGIILCYTPGQTARSEDALPPPDRLMTDMLAFFEERVRLATEAGVERLWLDPGFGFALGLPDGPDRIAYQTESQLQAFRLRALGWPVCQTLTSSVHLFRDEVRCGETASAVLALIGRANLLRSHEVARVQPVLDMQRYDVALG